MRRFGLVLVMVVAMVATGNGRTPTAKTQRPASRPKEIQTQLRNVQPHIGKQDQSILIFDGTVQVTYWSSEVETFFVQQNSVSIGIQNLPTIAAEMAKCEPGSQIQLRAYLLPNANELTPIKATVVGSSAPDETPTLALKDSGIGLGQKGQAAGTYVRHRGIVRSVVIDYQERRTDIFIANIGRTLIGTLRLCISPDQAQSFVGRTVEIHGAIARVSDINPRKALPAVFMMKLSQLQVIKDSTLLPEMPPILQKQRGTLAFKEPAGRGVIVVGGFPENEKANEKPPLIGTFFGPTVGMCQPDDEIEVWGKMGDTNAKNHFWMTNWILIRHPKPAAEKIPVEVISGTILEHTQTDSTCDLLVSTDQGNVHVIVTPPPVFDAPSIATLRDGNRIKATGLVISRDVSEPVKSYSGGSLTGSAERTQYVRSFSDVQMVTSPIQLERRTIGLGIAIGILLNLGIFAWGRMLRRQVATRTQGLALANTQMGLAFDTIREGVLIGNENANWTQCNRRFQQIFGFTPHTGMSFDQCLDRIAELVSDRKQFQAFRDLASKANSQSSEFQLLDPPRTIHIHASETQPAWIAHSNTIESVSKQRFWAFENVTQQRRLEAELIQSQKMEIIGRLSGGVAHDFNNLLMVMRASLTMISRRAKDQILDLEQFTSTAETAVDRAAGLTSRLLDFSRRTSLNQEAFDLNQIVHSARSLVEPALPDSIQLEKQLLADCLMVDIDAARMEQVIVNLCLNARDAMEANGGTIIVTTGRVDESTDSTKTSLPDVFLEVHDQGTGMSPEQMDQIFEPFFTTKPSGVGTGLGLSMAHGVVAHHGGTLTCQSTPGDGSVFRIVLPASARVIPRQVLRTSRQEITSDLGASSKEESGQLLPTLKILLVDDLALVRRAQEGLLGDLGHEVSSVSSAAEAISRIESGESFDLVFADRSMPKMNGIELFREIIQRHPKMPTIIATGYRSDGEEIEQLLEALPRCPVFLPKPYSNRQLNQAIAAALQSAKTATSA